MKKTIVNGIVLILSVMLAAISLASCGSADSKSVIIGSWDSVEAPGTVYVFNEDGTGALEMDGVTTMNYTYTEKDSEIEISYEGVVEPQVYTYKLNDTTLTLIDKSTDTAIDYIKK